MLRPIIRFLWDDKCPRCKAPVPVTFDKRTAKCSQCGADVELDQLTIRGRDIVILVIVTFCADFVPMLSMKIISGSVLLGLWLYKSFKWRLQSEMDSGSTTPES
jgi:uncharacterized protein (DUF983 family)